MIQKKRQLLYGGILGIIVLVGVYGMALLYKRTHIEITHVIRQQNMAESVYETSFEQVSDVYKASTSKKIASELHYLTKREGTFEDPVWSYNPFGTNECAFYLGFTTKEYAYLTYTITVDADAIEAFTKTAYIMGGESATKLHEYSIVGFVPGYENTVTLQLFDKQNRLLEESKVTFLVPEVHNQKEVLVEYKSGESSQELSDGLYTAFSFGDDDLKSKATLLYDNNGVMRSRFPQIGSYGSRIEQIGENILYIIKKNKLAVVSPIGQVMKVYTISGYTYHHDFEYNEEQGKLLILANDASEEATTVEDVLISIDVETGEVEEVIDFKQLLPEVYEKAVKAKEAGAISESSDGDSDKLDWFHVNAFDMVDSDSMIFSARELSLIVKVDNVWTDPVADYIIADDFLLADTKQESLLLSKGGNETFVSQFGQHHVVVQKEESMAEGTYYLTLFNNNRGESTTRPEISYSGLKNTGVKKFSENDGIYSYYYRYLVDENEGTYTLADSFEVPYAGIVSNAQTYEGNIVVCSGTPNVVGEYDQNGTLIRELALENQILTYRTQKYSYLGFWFQNR